MDMDILEANNNFTLSSVINGPVLSTVITLIMVTAFVANSFVICITFCYSKSWKQPSTIFLTSLLLGDLVAIVVMPFSVISTAYGEWIFGQSVEEKYGVCQFAAYMFWYSVFIIIMTLALISLDRFLFIVKPLFYRRHIYMKPQIAVTVVIIGWIVCAILNTTPLYGLGLFHFSESHGFCIPGWEEQLGYAIYMLLVFGILLSCIVVTSIWTCCSTHNFLTRAERRSRTNIFAEEENIYTTTKRKIIGIFGALLLMNALCYAPSVVVGTLATFTTLPHEVYVTVAICFLCSTIGNPLVQTLFREDMKSAVKKIFMRYCCFKSKWKPKVGDLSTRRSTISSSGRFTSSSGRFASFSGRFTSSSSECTTV